MVNNCRLDIEDFDFIASLGDVPEAFAAFDAPPEVGVEWHKSENQLTLGSCNGTAGASCLERLEFVRNRRITQLSKIYAYIGSQVIGGLDGADQGSRPSDFLKLEGVCEESLTGYPTAYPNKASRTAILSPANRAAAKPYKAQSVCTFRKDATAADFRQFIGGGGAILFGCRWYGFIPKNRIVTAYAPPATARGGHAMAILGYTTGGNLIAVNSHADGKYEIAPAALQQLLRYSGNVFVGLMGNEGAPVDWVADSPWNFGG